jgi:hypothetical protein
VLSAIETHCFFTDLLLLSSAADETVKKWTRYRYARGGGMETWYEHDLEQAIAGKRGIEIAQ